MPCGSGVVKLEDGSRQRSETITFDLNQGFGNFLNCTERKSPFENESAISPAISEPMLKYNPLAEIKTLDDYTGA